MYFLTRSLLARQAGKEGAFIGKSNEEANASVALYPPLEKGGFSLCYT
jgi:hypothetical protein